MEQLTPKQNEVLALMAKGLTNGQIAERLGISLAGAKWHVSEVLSRLGVASREEAVAVWKSQHGFRARMRGLIGVPVAVQFVGSAASVASVAVLAVVAVAVVGTYLDGRDDSTMSIADEVAALPTTLDVIAAMPTPNGPKPDFGRGPSFGPAERFVAEGRGADTTDAFEAGGGYEEYAFYLRVQPATADGTSLELVCGDVREEVPLDFRGEDHAGFVVSPPVGSTACHFDVDTTGNWRIESK